MHPKDLSLLVPLRYSTDLLLLTSYQIAPQCMLHTSYSLMTHVAACRGLTTQTVDRTQLLNRAFAALRERDVLYKSVQHQPVLQYADFPFSPSPSDVWLNFPRVLPCYPSVPFPLHSFFLVIRFTPEPSTLFPHHHHCQRLRSFSVLPRISTTDTPSQSTRRRGDRRSHADFLTHSHAGGRAECPNPSSSTLTIPYSTSGP